MLRLLVVDDDPLFRSVLTDVLVELGHEVHSAGDGRTGLDMASRQPLDGVFADMHMPGWDGLELARRLARLPDAPPVVLVSAVSLSDLDEQVRRWGAPVVSILEKPVGRGGIEAACQALAVARRASVAEPCPTANPVSEADDEPAWLDLVRGPVAQLNPARVWFQAWQQQASGALLVSRPRALTRIGFQAGQIVEVGGLPGLLARSLPPGASADGLAAAVGGAVVAGLSVDAALTEVATEVARWMVEVKAGEVWFDSKWTSLAGARPLPGTPVAQLATAIANIPFTDTIAAWDPLASARVQARWPGAPRESWLLGPWARRVYCAAGSQTVRALLDELALGAPERRIQALRALELLTRLHLVVLER